MKSNNTMGEQLAEIDPSEDCTFNLMLGGIDDIDGKLVATPFCSVTLSSRQMCESIPEEFVIRDPDTLRNLRKQTTPEPELTSLLPNRVEIRSFNLAYMRRVPIYGLYIRFGSGKKQHGRILVFSSVTQPAFVPLAEFCNFKVVA